MIFQFHAMGLFQAVLVFELFNSSASVDELLLTRKEWMAG